MYVVYEISCNISDRKYIGSTKNLQKRFKQHVCLLQRDAHHSVFFQNFYNKYKDTVELYINVLSEHENETDCKEAEEKLINENYSNLFNVSKKASGGDLLSYHPQKEDIIRRISATLKERVSLLTPSQRSSLYGLKGINNGMYGKAHTEESKKLISEKVSSYVKSNGHHQKGKSLEEMYGKDKANRILSDLSTAASARTGKLNPFYGKKHSPETKSKLSEISKTRTEKMNKEGKTPPTAIPVFVQGVYYTSSASAAKHLGVLSSTLNYRVRSRNWEYRSYYYAHSPKKFEDLKLYDKDSIVLIDGVEYSSVDIASEILNIPRSTLLYRCYSETEEMKNYILKRPTSIESEYQKSIQLVE